MVFVHQASRTQSVKVGHHWSGTVVCVYSCKRIYEVLSISFKLALETSLTNVATVAGAMLVRLKRPKRAPPSAEDRISLMSAMGSSETVRWQPCGPHHDVRKLLVARQPRESVIINEQAVIRF